MYSVLSTDITVQIQFERIIGLKKKTNNNSINNRRTGHPPITFWEIALVVIMIVVIHQASVSISPSLRINGSIFRSRSGQYFSKSCSHRRRSVTHGEPGPWL